MLPASACGLVETARVTRYLATESAGQCGPCVHGLDAIAHALESLASPHPAAPSRPGSNAGSNRFADAAPADIPTGPRASSPPHSKPSLPSSSFTSAGAAAVTVGRYCPSTSAHDEHHDPRQPDRLQGTRALRRAPPRADQPGRLGLPHRRRRAGRAAIYCNTPGVPQRPARRWHFSSPPRKARREGTCRRLASPPPLTLTKNLGAVEGRCGSRCSGGWIGAPDLRYIGGRVDGGPAREAPAIRLRSAPGST